MITIFLIAINAIITLIFMHKEQPRDFLFFPYQLARGQGIRGLIYSQFSHMGWGHLFFNMLTLFFFGRPMELVSPGVMLLAYFLAAAGADLATYLFHKNDPDYATLGASGSVAGVLFCSIVYFPDQSIFIFPLPIPIPAPIFAVLYIVGSMMLARSERGSVNHEAHIGGAIIGFLVAAISSPAALSNFWDTVLGYLPG
ncbi:MAG: rhomboid family intramembrane serine protease [Spirochaetaceae bacterium]|nr:rhomboid family intramembrane serine protease [Spirochaetaceae bacterium]|tara:strand:+ start:15852 stop:16445 length:594 start_codon:yes stop_codon:yes gene_type:complete